MIFSDTEKKQPYKSHMIALIHTSIKIKLIFAKVLQNFHAQSNEALQYNRYEISYDH